MFVHSAKRELVSTESVEVSAGTRRLERIKLNRMIAVTVCVVRQQLHNEL